jgi:hypothetical protein
MNQEKRADALISYLKNIKKSYFVNYSLEEIVKGFFKNEKKYASDISLVDVSKNATSSDSAVIKSIFITLDINSPQDYGIILFGHENRKYFPGYKVNFLLETDIGIRNAHVTSGREGDRTGDRLAGSYIVANLPEWYEKHKELKKGSLIRIDIIERDKKYKLSIYKL